MHNDSRRTQLTSLTAGHLSSFFTSKIDAICANNAVTQLNLKNGLMQNSAIFHLELLLM